MLTRSAASFALALALAAASADAAPTVARAPATAAPLASIAPAPRPALPDIVPPTRAAIQALPAASGDAEWRCLAEAVYFEARGEPVPGQVAVAEVIVNRAESPRFPGSVCAVVGQGAGRSGGCQFSFACDGRPETIRDRAAWEKAGKVARLALDGRVRDLTGGALYFHTRAVRPRWASILPRTAEIGAHLFYAAEGAGTRIASN